MSKRLTLTLVIIVALSYLLSACGVRPQVDFYMDPIATGEGQRINEETGSVTVEEAGVSITVSAVDTVDLLNVTSDAHVNPYIYVSDWGVARPRYTVFDVTIKNNRESEVRIDPSSAVLMAEDGEQYEAIPYRVFKERYDAYPRFGREIIYYPPRYVHYPPSYYRYRWWRRPWYYHYDLYWAYRPYRVRRVYDLTYFKNAVLEGTMLRSVKLYSGGKRQGFMVFPVLSPDAGELRLIIPGITIYQRGEGMKVKFQFHFRRIPAVKGKNDSKEDAGAGRGR